MLGSIPHVTLLYVLEKERCSILGLPDKPTSTQKVFNSGFRADTKVFNAGFNALQKNKQTISSMMGLHDKPTLTPKFFNSGLREFSILASMLYQKIKNKKNEPTLTFYIGYNHTIYWCSKWVCRTNQHWH